jgi:hypothetical protein
MEFHCRKQRSGTLRTRIHLVKPLSSSQAGSARGQLALLTSARWAKAVVDLFTQRASDYK